MCWEDVKIGRSTQSASWVIEVAADTPTLILPVDMHRTSLIIAPAAAGTLFVAPQRDLVAGMGFSLAAGQPPVQLDLFHQGTLVRGPWFGLAVGAPGSFLLIVSTLPYDKPSQLPLYSAG